MEPEGPFTDTGKRNDAFSILEHVGRSKGPSKGAATLVFFTSAAVGGLTFFFTLDITLWFGIKTEEPWMQITVPYILTFVAWIAAYFLIHSTLQMLADRALFRQSRDRLSALNLSLFELDQLRRHVEHGNLKHKELLVAVIEDIKESSPAAQ